MTTHTLAVKMPLSVAKMALTSAKLCMGTKKQP